MKLPLFAAKYEKAGPPEKIRLVREAIPEWHLHFEKSRTWAMRCLERGEYSFFLSHLLLSLQCHDPELGLLTLRAGVRALIRRGPHKRGYWLGSRLIRCARGLMTEYRYWDALLGLLQSGPEEDVVGVVRLLDSEQDYTHVAPVDARLKAKSLLLDRLVEGGSAAIAELVLYFPRLSESVVSWARSTTDGRIRNALRIGLNMPEELVHWWVGHHYGDYVSLGDQVPPPIRWDSTTWNWFDQALRVPRLAMFVTEMLEIHQPVELETPHQQILRRAYLRTAARGRWTLFGSRRGDWNVDQWHEFLEANLGREDYTRFLLEEPFFWSGIRQATRLRWCDPALGPVSSYETLKELLQLTGVLLYSRERGKVKWRGAVGRTWWQPPDSIGEFLGRDRIGEVKYQLPGGSFPSSPQMLIHLTLPFSGSNGMFLYRFGGSSSPQVTGEDFELAREFRDGLV